MRIDFYHVDAFEVATYEPIWRALRSLGVDARLVGPPDGKNRAARGWFDHGAFVEACCGRRLPFETEADPGAVGVTTQNTEIVAAYRHPHIRLMYGPVMYPSAWGLSQHAASRFDCILAHGPYYQRHLARWKREWQTPVVGYPRYDDYFAGKLDLAALRRKHGVDHAKPILLYLPTWAENSSFDQYFEIIAEAGNRFQVIVRPHHCTARFEPQRMERLRASGARLATGPFDLPELLAVADLVVADARSCSLLEAIMCGRRVLGLASVAAQDEEWMRATGLAALSPCCHSPERFGEAVERCLAQPEDNAPRAVWRDEHVAFRDGSAANRAAQAILTAIERTVKSAAAPARPAPRPAVATRPAGAPRVSVVLPTYNHLRFLPAAIQSVLDQTYTDFELIIVNDGSTDGTRDYLERLRHPRIRVLHQQNQRLPRALNTGFRAARGDLLTWVSSDNSCAPIFLEALVGALDAWPEAGMAVSAFASIDPEGRITGIRRDQDLSPACLFTGNPGIAAFLYRREYQQAVGEYDPALEGAEDWDLWVRLSELAPVVYVPEILYYYRRHDATMTSQIPARVRESSLQVIPRALERCQHQLNLDKLYPAIAECSNREHAEAEACFDLGTNLLWSPYAPADLAVPFLKAAFEKSQVPGVLANLALALARAGHWEDLAQCLPHLGQINQPAIQEVFSNLSAALKRRQPLILTGPPPFGLTSTTSELLARTLGRRRVYSLTMAFSDAKNRDAERGMPPQASRPEAVESRKSLAVPVDSSGRTSPAAPEVSQSSLATSKSRAEFMAEAQACLAQGELEATRDVLEEALASSPGDLEVRETLGNICFQVEDFEAASRHYRFVTERQPRTADAWLRLAHAAHRNDQIEEFEHALGRVLALEPEHRDAQKFLGDLNLENGLNLEAVLAYKRVLRQTPNGPVNSRRRRPLTSAFWVLMPETNWRGRT